jgi:hypothetical protein
LHDAACRGMDTGDWFAFPLVDPRAVRRALAVCWSCPVRAECLQAGMGEEFGVWGGTLPEQRHNMRGGRPSTPCSICGTMFVPRTGQRRASAGRWVYCSDPCAAKGSHERKRRFDKRRASPVDGRRT